MAAKKVGFKPKPNNNRAGDVEKWVSERFAPDGREHEGVLSQQNAAVTPQNVVQTTPTETKPKMKRLTIDVTEKLHRAIKMKAVEQGTPMADMLRELLESNYL